MTNFSGSDYYACLLRFWCSEANLLWRVSLEDPHTGELRYFASPQHAFAFIESLLNRLSVDESPDALFPNVED